MRRRLDRATAFRRLPRLSSASVNTLIVVRPIIGCSACHAIHGDQVRGGASYGGLPYYGFHKAAMAWRYMSISGEFRVAERLADEPSGER